MKKQDSQTPALMNEDDINLLPDEMCGRPLTLDGFRPAGVTVLIDQRTSFVDINLLRSLHFPPDEMGGSPLNLDGYRPGGVTVPINQRTSFVQQHQSDNVVYGENMPGRVMAPTDQMLYFPPNKMGDSPLTLNGYRPPGGVMTLTDQETNMDQSVNVAHGENMSGRVMTPTVRELNYPLVDSFSYEIPPVLGNTAFEKEKETEELDPLEIRRIRQIFQNVSLEKKRGKEKN